VGITEAGEFQVIHPLDPSSRPVAARSTVPLDRGHVGRELIIVFERGDVQKPIVLGVLWHATDKPSVEQCILTAEREIVLRCGKASITLTRAGKVIIRGAYVLSRSSGANQVKGASVQIN
jgi:hypothetical protein